jgi:HCOMODA/2-hydroxy-3-carboxy-muconic semialdehyde decarboxylase
VTDALPALHGQGALAGAPVPVFGDARLVRDAARAAALAAVLGDGWAIVLRGNGAVTAGRTLGHAVARMVLLEAAAAVFLRARAAGEPRPLRAEEAAAWQAAGDDLLDRLWAHHRAVSGP